MINTRVKLVIWNLDDTFWKGTLSEGKIEKVEENINIVRTLVDRGIMCSIVSKNEYEDVEKKLKLWEIWDCFVFPHISWLPIGEQVKQLLEQCSLRPDNTLFIDDNISNLREVEYYNLNIMTELSNCLSNDFLDNEFLKGKDDKEHSRLKQYKALEERNIVEQTYPSNKDFLRDSNIEININYDCNSHIDRIYELIERANQQNFTKIRLSKSEVKKLIANKNYLCASISVKDKFEDYGITGFYALKDSCLEHFVFSCKTIGLGIENYLYKKLGYPSVNIIDPVSTELDKDYAEKIDWIKETEISFESNNTNLVRPRLLMIGGCDLKQVSQYLAGNFDVVEEYNTVVDGYEIRTSNTIDLVNQLEMPQDIQKDFLDKLPFMAKGITYNSQIYKKGYDIIVISLADDFIRGIYKNKSNGFCVGMGGYFNQDKCLKWFNNEDIRSLLEDFEYLGRIESAEFKKNVEFILSHIDKKSKVFVINGVDIDVSDWIGNDRVQRNKEMNQVVDEIIKKYPEISLIDMRKIVTSRSELAANDNRHFDRKTYYLLAKELIDQAKNELNAHNKSIISIEASELIKRIKRKFEKWEGYTEEKIINTQNLYLYKTSYGDLNNLEIISSSTIDEIKHGNAYLVVGDDVNFKNRSLVEFENYVYEKYLGRKIVCFYGNCHTGAVKRYLMTSPEFNKKYVIFPLKEIQEVRDPSYFDQPVFKACDVFIHQSIWKKNRYGEAYASENVIKKLNSRCVVIAMPNVYHLPKCLFPQYYEATELRYKNRTYFFRDKIIDEGILKGKSLRNIANEYYDYKFDDETIRKEYIEFIEIVKKREFDWDIKVSDYIDSNIKETQMFYELNHPTNSLIKYYATGILNILFKDSYSIGEIEPYKMDSYQMPFLTQVRDALGLSYSTKNKLIRDTGVKIRSTKMDIYEYVKQYYAAVWICGEFKKKIDIQSKSLWYIYKIQYLLIRVYNKLIRKQ